MEGERERPVAARVLRTRSAVALARASEAALVGGGTLALCLAALVASGGTSGQPAGWVAAAGAGLLAAASWWLEHRPQSKGIARRIDAELGFDGALVTAFEAEQRPRASELGRALARRVAARLPLRSALRAALPPSMAVAAFPLAALALLALAQQRAAERRPGPPGAALTVQALAEVGELAQLVAAERGLLSPPELEAALSLATEAQRLAAGLADPAQARELLESATAWMEELASSLPVDRGAARERLERASALTDAARDAADPAGADPAERAGEGSLAAGPSREGSAELAPGVPSGTMPGLDPSPADPAGAQATPTSPAAHDPGVGLVGGRWWPARDEELVRRWVEARRSASGER